MPHAIIDEFDGVHPVELSRRISEIDLTNHRRRADTETLPPRYQPELPNIDFEVEKHEDHISSAEIEGMKTPINVPAPPPPTPDDHSSYPSDTEQEDDVTSNNSSEADIPITYSDKHLNAQDDAPVTPRGDTFPVDSPGLTQVDVVELSNATTPKKPTSVDTEAIPTSGTLTVEKNPMIYSRDELLKLKPIVEVVPEETPTATVENHGDDNENTPRASNEPAKKKKKGRSGKKKAAPTGFEG